MRLTEFVAWFKAHPDQSSSSIRNALGLRHISEVQNYLHQINVVTRRGRCPLMHRANVALHTFASIPDEPRKSLQTIRERIRKARPAQAGEPLEQTLLKKATVEPCVFPAMCHTCKKMRRHVFERVAVVGHAAVVKATCGKCGKETTK